jgi:transposase InsO family protein
MIVLQWQFQDEVDRTMECYLVDDLPYPCLAGLEFTAKYGLGAAFDGQTGETSLFDMNRVPPDAIIHQGPPQIDSDIRPTFCPDLDELKKRFPGALVQTDVNVLPIAFRTPPKAVHTPPSKGMGDEDRTAFARELLTYEIDPTCTPERILQYTIQQETERAEIMCAVAAASTDTVIAQVNAATTETHPNSDSASAETSMFDAIVDQADHPLHRDKLRALLLRHKSVFSQGAAEIGHSKGDDVQLKVLSDRPINLPNYKTPLKLREWLKNELRDLEKAGIIRKSLSGWNSPCLVVPKKVDVNDVVKDPNKSKGHRLVIDYREINKILDDVSFPLPRITDIASSYAGCKVFSSVDIRHAFYSIHLHPESRKITAFSCELGKYEFAFLPQGLKISPAIFQSRITHTLSEAPQSSPYLDDIITGDPTPDEHLDSLDKMFHALEAGGFKLKLSKSQFMKDKVEFAGTLVTREGCQIQPSKLESVDKLQLPTTVAEVKTLTGFTSFLREHVPYYCDLVQPFAELCVKAEQRLKADVVKFCDARHTKALQELKNLLKSNQVLAFPDHNEPFELYTDASRHSISGVLMQSSRPVSYFSAPLRGTQLCWSALVKEAFAIKKAVEYFKTIITLAKVHLFCDHKPLHNFLHTKTANQMVNRWSLEIQEHQITFEWVESERNISDCLSRLVENELHVQHDPIDVEPDFTKDQKSQARLALEREKRLQKAAKNKPDLTATAQEVGEAIAEACDILPVYTTTPASSLTDTYLVAFVKEDSDLQVKDNMLIEKQLTPTDIILPCKVTTSADNETQVQDVCIGVCATVSKHDKQPPQGIEAENVHVNACTTKPKVPQQPTTASIHPTDDSEKRQKEAILTQYHNNRMLEEPDSYSLDELNFILNPPKVDLSQMQAAQDRDPYCIRVKRALPTIPLERRDFVLIDDVLYKVVRTTFQKHEAVPRLALVIPPKWGPTMLVNTHLELRHPGFDKTASVLAQRVYWRGMWSQIRRFVTSCPYCVLKSLLPCKYPQCHTPIPNRPFQKLNVDTWSPGKDLGTGAALTVVDDFSQYPFVIPIADKTAEEAAKAFKQVFALCLGNIKEVVSDDGSEFKGAFAEFLSHNNIKHIKTMPHQPQGNGRVERFHRYLNEVVRMTLHFDPKADWVAAADAAVEAYRKLPHTSTGESPAFLVTNRDPALQIDHLLPVITRDSMVPETNNLALDQRKYAHALARKNLCLSRRRADKKREHTTADERLRVGDLVVFMNPVRSKADPKWACGYRIVEKMGERGAIIEHVETGHKLKTSVRHLRRTDPVTELMRLSMIDVFPGRTKLYFPAEELKDLDWPGITANSPVEVHDGVRDKINEAVADKSRQRYPQRAVHPEIKQQTDTGVSAPPNPQEPRPRRSQRPKARSSRLDPYIAPTSYLARATRVKHALHGTLLALHQVTS